MQEIKSRKMGALEKLTIIINDQAAGSTAVSAMLKVNAQIEFKLFKKAWHILFQRHPLLRATKRVQEKDYFFDFNADFSNIPIKHLQTEVFSEVEHEYGKKILMSFDLSHYFWRATLVTMKQECCSYVIFGAPHTICDGKCISWLFGDLLRIILDFQKGIIPNTNSFPIPPAIDKILDKTKFLPAKDTEASSTNSMPFEKEATLNSASSENLLRVLEEGDLEKLLAACRRHGATLTSAFNAALALSILGAQEEQNDNITLSIAFSLRPYTKQPVSDRDMAFYAHQLSFNLDPHASCDFWDLALQAKKKSMQAISEYTLLSEDDYELFDKIAVSIQDNIQQKQFFIPYTISNVGVIDDAFVGCETFGMGDFYFTVRNQSIFVFTIFMATIHHKLYLNFNYSSPAMSKETATKLASRVFYYLRSHLNS